MRTQLHRGSIIGKVIAATLASAALGLPAAALAQTAKEQQLEARVAELERLVQQLLAEKKAGAAPAAGAPAAAPAKPAGPPVQATSIVPNAAPGTSFMITGFVKADALFTNTSDGELPEENAARDYYVPATTPVGGVDEGTDLNFHLKNSRINFGTDTILEGGDKLMTRFEVDFFGSSLGNQRVTNTYAPVLRHAYAEWRHWLVGQTWSNFQDALTLPETADFIGPTDGTVFVRQPQVRYKYGGFSFSAENRETTISPYAPGLTTVTGSERITSDDGWAPDLTARYTWKGDWGHLSAAALLRELTLETTSAAQSTTGINSPIDDSTWTGALSLSGKLMIGQDDIRFMLLGGNLGRYVALNFTNDAVINSNGELEGIDGYAGFVAYRHLWSSKLRSNIYFAMESYDNDTDLTGGLVNESSYSGVVNLFYSPLPKLDVGAEYRYAVRELENGNDGDLNRLQFTTKYSF
jgi:hypothetical protein